MKKIKKFLRENKLTASIYNKLWIIKNRKTIQKNEQRRLAVQNNGVGLIHFLQDALKGEFFFFDMGTLLGIIREGRLLGHDMDVDLGAIVDGEEGKLRIRELLIKAGCEHARSFVIDEIGVVEDSFVYSEIRFDVAYYKQIEDKSVMYLMYTDPAKSRQDGLYDVVELSVSQIQDLDTVDFHGKSINVPRNSEEYLAQRYGANWRIPDKNYIYWKGPSTRPTDLLAKQIIN